MIELKNIKRHYDDYMILNNINIKISSPCLISIIGPSGCGKSTLLNIISLMDNSFEGEYIFLNKNVKELSTKEKEEYLSSYITYLFQEPNFIDEESIKVNLELITHLELNKDKALELLKDFSLIKDLDTPCKVLSRGEKKRLMIIGAILRNTPLIICDEITSGLDVTSTKIVMESLKRLSKDKIVILVTHNEDIASLYSSYTYHFKNHMLPNIEINSKKIDVDRVKKNTKLDFKYLLSHARKMITRKRVRIFILFFSMIICLFTMGLSFLIKGAMEQSLKDSLSSYYGTNQIIMKSKDSFSQIKKMEVVDSNEFEDFIINYDDLIESTSQSYLCNYENYFVDRNDFLINISGFNYSLDNYGVRNINEFSLLKFANEVYPKVEELKENQIVIGLSESKIYDLCRKLNLSGYKYDSLSKYFISNSISSKIIIENKSWEYYLSIPFEIVGFVRSNNPCIYSSLSSFNELYIEETMKLPYSYFPLENDYYPWTTKKFCTLQIKEENVVSFFKRMLLDKRMNKYSFHILQDEQIPVFSKENPDIKHIYLTYKNENNISLHTIEEICFNNKNIISYIPCGSKSFNVDEQALINGFELPTYLSSNEGTINEFIDYNSFSNNNLGNYQSNYFTSNSNDFYSLSMLDCSKENYVKFKDYSKQNISLLSGSYPKKENEIMISKKLSENLNIDVSETIYLVSLVSIEQINNKYKNNFKTIPFKVSGITKEEDLSFYSDNLFPLVLSNIHLGIFQEDQEISKCLITLKDNNEDFIMFLNNQYQDFEFINPLSEYLKSINESLSYLSTGLLFFSFVVLISSLFMMILVNYLFLKEGEKEIVIYSFLGYQKWSIFNYFLLINVILILGGMLISLTLLFFTSLILPMLDSSITSVYLSFLPFGLIIMVCLFSFIISSLINMRFFIKKDVISLLKN